MEHTRVDEVTGQPVSLSCYDYSANGDAGSHSNLDGQIRECPRYANWGCFTANFTLNGWNTPDPITDQLHKVRKILLFPNSSEFLEFFIDSKIQGCSMFEPEVRATECFDYVEGSYACKTQCTGDQCNTGDFPKVPFQCQSCQVEFDHMFNVVSGDIDCMRDPTGNLMDCPGGYSLFSLESGDLIR